MITNYLKTGFRHLLRNKIDAFINTGGLALGIAIAILIGLWVHDELTFNSYHKRHERVAQVYKGTGQKWLPYPLAVELKENYRQSFKHIVTALPPYDMIISSEENRFNATGQYVEPALPEMLTLEMIEGDWSALSDRHSVILSESMAHSLFGDEGALGKLARINNRSDVKVTGVYRDLPHNSDFNNVKFFAPWDLVVSENPGITQALWDDHFVFVYTELALGATVEQVATSIADAEVNVIRDLDYMKDEFDRDTQVWLQPMDKWHLHSTFADGGLSSGPIRFVYMVGAIGAFVLMLACINFMNLSTARSEKRMREVGVRKAIGSMRSQLIGQFLCESFIVVAISFVAAVLVASLFLPAFNELSGKQLTMPWSNLLFWASAFVLMTFTGFIAGSYPALYLSSFRPAIVLKGQQSAGKLATLLRRTLVTVQFTVSITLIIATIVVYKQIVFAKDREVGYSRGGLLIVPGRSFNNNFNPIREELMQTGVVKNVAAAGGMVTSAWSQGGGFQWRGMEPDVNLTIGALGINAAFGETVGWKIIAGRDFSEIISSDSSAFVINEAAAQAMGLDIPVGEVVHWKSKWHYNVDKDFTIIGVVSNLMMKSPFDTIMPAVFYLKNDFGTIHIRLADDVNTKEALSKIEQVFRKTAPDVPFEYKFADEEYNRKFAYEEQIGRLGLVFTILAVLISCLGLFGMASFMTERRTKEIGIRKVVGASVFSLWRMMSTEFVALVAFSLVIASPVAFYALNKWMESFVYRTEISWEIFAAAGGGAVFITLATVSFQLLKAANRSPIHSLKTE